MPQPVRSFQRFARLIFPYAALWLRAASRLILRSSFAILGFFVGVWHGSINWRWFTVLLTGAIGLTSVGEYAVGLAVGLLAVLSLGSYCWHWAANLPGSLRSAKWFFLLAMAVGAGLMYFEVDQIRGASQWSRIPKAWNAMLIASTVRMESFPATVTHPPLVPDIAPQPIQTDKEGRPGKGILAPDEVLTVAATQVRLAAGPNRDSEMFLKVRVKSKKPLEVRQATIDGVMNVVEDQRIEKTMEDEAWSRLLPDDPAGVSAQLPSNNEGLIIDSSPISLTEAQWVEFQSAKTELLFIIRIVNLRGKHLLEFCAHVNKDQIITPCLSHNGP